ncbi:MAG: PD40 domain-containing protein [Anaerolineaceae bacterium]|nr:PD40 domain-containing protein [Anaerolineaceae bacterium]
MSDLSPTPQFEEEIRAAVAVPLANEQFVKSLHTRLIHQAASQRKVNRPFFLRPAWVTVFIITILAVSILVIGPQRVLAAVRGLFGYIPGVGIVDQSAPIRLLAEPVSVTRDGITVTVTSATLTREKTQVAYRIFGVPGSAYPDHEDISGCMQREYLRLADGTQLAQINYGYEPVPANVNEAVFVIPCIANTLPGKAPENWELPLRFVLAPPDLTVMPVIELSPSPQVSLTPGDSANAKPTALADSSVTVNKVIETSNGYILIGQFQPHSKPGESFQQTGAFKIRDASGKNISYSYPLDVNDEINLESAGMSGVGWAAQFKAAGLVYPLTISFSGVDIFPADPDAAVEFTFDAGANPQPGQEWTPNQEILLAGHTLKVTSISVDSRNGYSFMFQVDPKVYSASVHIVGYTPNGGGGGGGGGLTDGKFNASLSFAQLPTGVLTVTLSNLAVIGDPITWQGQWSPPTPRTDLPANPTPQSGLCLTADSLAQLQPAPSTMANGKALIYEKLDTGTWGLAVYNLDGSQKQVVVPNGNWGALSPDGSQVAYSASDNGIHIVDVASQTENILPGAGGFNLHWSPDGKQIAYVGMGDGVINSLFVITTDGTPARQISDLSYESVIGWSPDGKLFFVAPYTGGAAWKVYSYDLVSGTTQERFTIENGTPKFLNPKLSPDGNWIAYRGRDNSSLYLVHPDGSDMYLVLDNVGAAGVEWSRTGWLGVSLKGQNSTESTIVLIKPEGCEAYRMPSLLQGDLEGLFIP